MLLGLVKDMIYSFVKYAKNTFVFGVILGLTFLPVTAIYAQTISLFVTDIGTSQTYSQINCTEYAGGQFRINSHPDMDNVNEIRLPFTKQNAGANAGSFSNLRLYENGVLLETVPSFSINWLYHNNVQALPDTNSDNWTIIPLAGEYDIASTSQIEIELSCSGSSVFRNMFIAGGYNGIDLFLKTGGFVANGSAIVGFSYTEPVPDNLPLNFDLLGSTSPMDIVNAVTTGVQATSDNVTPLYAILGVPVSFIIGRSLVLFIRSSV